MNNFKYQATFAYTVLSATGEVLTRVAACNKAEALEWAQARYGKEVQVQRPPRR